MIGVNAKTETEDETGCQRSGEGSGKCHEARKIIIKICAATTRWECVS